MRRVNNLWEKISSKDALYRAYLQARKGKRRNHACHKFESNLGANINNLHDELITGSYKPHKPNRFFVYEPKKRLIEAPAFRDLVVQHAIYAQIMPIFDNKFVSTSFACRWGLGTHKAADYLQEAMRLSDSNAWVLKVDCRKFFYSINHQILKSQYRRFIKCQKTCEIMDLFVYREEGIGVPIGNLMSQVFGLLYLNQLDHFIKRNLKIKYYARYVDDMVMICDSKPHADVVFKKIRQYMLEILKIDVSKYSITPKRKGINCFGFRTWASKRFIRKRSLYMAARRLRQLNIVAFISCLAHARKTASKNYLLNLARNQNVHLSIPESLR